MATKAAEKPKTEKPKADDKAADPAAAPEPRKSKKKLALILAILLLLGGAGTAAWNMMQGAAPAEGEEGEAAASEAPAEKKAPPVFLNMENFLVNLRDDDGDHYLQLGLVLQISDQQAVEEVKLQMPLIRNAILLLLSSKQSGDIATLEGKQLLTEQIVAEARKPLSLPEPNKGIEGVLYSTFVIQ